MNVRLWIQSVAVALCVGACRFGYQVNDDGAGNAGGDGDGDLSLGGADGSGSNGSGAQTSGDGGSGSNGAGGGADGSGGLGGGSADGGQTGAGGQTVCTADCPSMSLTFTGDVLTTAYGADGGSAFSDRCPAGQVVVGFQGYTSPAPQGEYINRLQIVCGTPEVTGSGPYGVSVGSGTTLPERGTGGNKAWSRFCSTDQIVIGFEGRSGLYVDQLIFYCAPLEISGTAGDYSLSFGTWEVLTDIGGTGGSAFPRTDCPSGFLAHGADGRAGTSIDKFQLACTEVGLVF